MFSETRGPDALATYVRKEMATDGTMACKHEERYTGLREHIRRNIRKKYALDLGAEIVILTTGDAFGTVLSEGVSLLFFSILSKEEGVIGDSGRRPVRHYSRLSINSIFHHIVHFERYLYHRCPSHRFSIRAFKPNLPVSIEVDIISIILLRLTD